MSSRTGKPGFKHRGISVAVGADGRLHCKVPVGRKPNGAPDRRHISAANDDPGKKNIKQKIDKLLDAVAKKAVRKAGRGETVQSWVSYWLDEIAPTGERPVGANSLQSYRSIAEVWFYPHLGALKLDELEVENLHAMYAAMRRRKLAKTTLLKAHAILRRALGVAVQWGKTSRNVAEMMDNPGSTKTRKRRAPDLKQVRRLLEVVERRDDALQWKLALALGLRQGEVLGLRWAFVDLREGTIVPDWQLQRLTYRHGCTNPAACAAGHHRRPCARPPQYEHGCPDPAACPGRRGEVLAKPKAAYCPHRVEVAACRRHRDDCPQPCAADCTEHAAQCPKRIGGLVFVRAKTIDLDDPDLQDDVDYEEYAEEEATHTIHVPTALVREIKEHRRRQAAARLAAGDLWDDNDLVFCDGNGRPIDPKTDLQRWHEIQREAGFKPVGTHARRRAAATVMYELGEKVETIQATLRHRDPRTTRGYVRVTAGLTQAAAERVGDALFPGSVTEIVTIRDRRQRAG
jgi:integrase